MKLIKNKKGDEKYLVPWWFFVIGLITVGIVVGVYIFAFSETSIRSYESEILTNKIADCLISNGKINQNFILNNFDLFKNCYLNENVIRNDNYFLQVEVYDKASCSIENGEYSCKTNITQSRKFGDYSMKQDCFIARKMRYAKDAVECYESYIETSNSDKNLVLYVIAGSRQRGDKI